MDRTSERRVEGLYERDADDRERHHDPEAREHLVIHGYRYAFVNVYKAVPT